MLNSMLFNMHMYCISSVLDSYVKYKIIIMLRGTTVTFSTPTTGGVVHLFVSNVEHIL